MVDLKEFANQLVNLTVKEVNELAQILKEEHAKGIREKSSVAIPLGTS